LDMRQLGLQPTPAMVDALKAAMAAAAEQQKQREAAGGAAGGVTASGPCVIRRRLRCSLPRLRLGAQRDLWWVADTLTQPLVPVPTSSSSSASSDDDSAAA